MAKRLPRFMRTPAGAVGTGLLGFIVVIAVFGPLFAAYGTSTPVAGPGQPPSPGLPLGTDYLGRDVLSRVLHGGLTVVVIGVASTLMAYLAGTAIGLASGYTRTLLDPILMRGVDLLLALPGVLLILLLVSGLGSHGYVLVIGVVLVQLPGISRIVRTATLEAVQRGYVEAAIARGERASTLLVREVLPNIAPVLLADFGIRFGASIILVASVNYLGLGLTPPAADWGLMISENRQYISLNLLSVLAPAIMLALLTVSVNLVADAYLSTLGKSIAGRASEAELLAAAGPAGVPGPTINTTTT